MSPINFKVEKKLKDCLGRAGVLETLHGKIETPSFVVVGTKASVKALSPEQVQGLGAQVVLGNTYHLYLEPGEDIVEEAGGIVEFMSWHGPTMTDSGGFQVFSLGDAFDAGGISKFISKDEIAETEGGSPAVYNKDLATSHGKLAIVDEEGVTFTSHLDGSMHRFIPERSIEIQHKLGADMIFAFDECTSPIAPHEYQKEALLRTTRWAERCLKSHRNNLEAKKKQGLFGVVQGGRFEDLRKESARDLAQLDFDGFGIGGSFSKDDLDNALVWVNEILPDEKPRHLLGIGEPEDLFLGVEHGVDLFDCVAPTRIGRNGQIYTKNGKINLLNEKYKRDLSRLDEGCGCYTCQNYTKSYLSHLFRAKEMFGATLASIHNLYFIVNLVKDIRQSILDDNFFEFKEEFLGKYMNL
jgi:queuine tRNA-ribosyltransferase